MHQVHLERCGLRRTLAGASRIASAARMFFVIVLVATCCAPTAHADLSLAKDVVNLPLSEGLVLGGVSSWARRAINVDSVVAAMVDGALGDRFNNPKAGDTLARPATLLKEGEDANAAWAEVQGVVRGEGAEATGVFGDSPRGAYVLFVVRSEAERVMMLEASGHGVSYVNGEPRVGDPYSFGFVRLPVLLHEGANQIILQHANRGEMRARLVAPTGEVELLQNDLTLPDVTEHGEYDFAVPLANCTAGTLRVVCRVVERVPDRAAWEQEFSLPALSVVKVPLRASLLHQAGIASQAHLCVSAVGTSGSPRELSACDVTFQLREAGQTHKLTYRSAIDRSVQYVSVVPALAEEHGAGTAADAAAQGASAARPGLVLSVHGASVEATNQAASYAAKRGLVIACPTNRRPYGFDWEDWGRLDALEAMDFVAREFETDPARQYLTGHSMGGHGTWQLGCLFPERFAAIAPSAGWLSFATYMSAVGQNFGPAGDDSVMRKFREVIASSDTVALLPRLQGKGVYILHGDADDNVPVSEARRAKEELTKLGIACEYFEQPGAGHWWDDESVKKALAGADGATKWGAACVDWPAMFEMFSRCSLADEKGAAEQPAVASPLGADGFHPGSFKRVFNKRFVLVYGTQGDEASRRWSFARARFDAEQWWYRGNGHAELMSDAEWIAKLHDGAARGRNAVLYGGPEVNSAARTLADNENHFARALEVVRGRGAWLLTVPSAFTDSLVGIIGGDTLSAMRATDRLSYFSAGVDYPSITVLGKDLWRRGEAGVVGAGFVRPDGVIDPTDIAWR